MRSILRRSGRSRLRRSGVAANTKIVPRGAEDAKVESQGYCLKR